MLSFSVTPAYTCLPPLSIGPLPRSSAYDFLSSTQTAFNPDVVSAFSSVFSYDSITHALAYKPVMKKVCSVVAQVDEEFRITQTLPNDPLLGLLSLPMHPPDFIPGERFTQEHTDALDLDPTNWLWPEEVKLCRWIVRAHEKAFAWVPDKRGCFDE